MRNKVFLFAFVLFLLSINVTYAQENFLYITADLSQNDLKIESNYDYQTEFNINDFIEKMNDEYLFTFSYSSETHFSDFKLKVILPENSVISEGQGALIISRPVKISTDGRKIFLEWSQELNIDEDFTAFAQYETKDTRVDYMIAVFIIIISAAFVIGYKSKTFKREKFIDKSVSADEKIILNILKKEKEVMQEDIRKKTDWSKTKISKVIRNLEMKELIEKKPYRKTNKLKLK